MTSPTPKTNAMLICDYVITERGTNKKSLIGVFENIGAATFPCTHFALSVYIKLTDAQGGYQFRLELVDLQSDIMIGKSEMPEEVRVPSPLDAHELVFNLRILKSKHIISVFFFHRRIISIENNVSPWGFPLGNQHFYIFQVIIKRLS